MCHPECRHTRVYHAALALLLHRNGPGAGVFRPSAWNVDGEFEKCIAVAMELEVRVEKALTPAVPPKENSPF